MSWGVLPWVYPVCDSLGFLYLGDYFLPHFREVFNYYLLEYFSWLFVCLLVDSYDSNVGAFQIVPEVPEVVLIFFFFSLCFIYFYHSIFYLSYPIFCLHYCTVDSLQSVFDLILPYSLLTNSFYFF